jgi:hypothetical protein
MSRFGLELVGAVECPPDFVSQPLDFQLQRASLRSVPAWTEAVHIFSTLNTNFQRLSMDSDRVAPAEKDSKQCESSRPAYSRGCQG